MKRIGIGCGVIILIAIIAAIALPDKSEKSGKKTVASEKAKTESKAKSAPAETDKEKTEKAPVTSDSGSRPKAPPKRTLEQALAELDSMIGLREVKAEIHKLVDYTKIVQARKAQGLKVPSISYHCVLPVPGLPVKTQ